MLTVPEDLGEDALRATLQLAWGIGGGSMTYRPVGWGSHHWEVVEAQGARWFATVDELETKRVNGSETLDAGFARLRAALATAVALKDAGLRCVVAPILTLAGEPLARLGDRFAVAVYPFVDGQSFRWGDGDSLPQQLGTAAMLASVHTAPAVVWRRHALADDLAVPLRDELEAACAGNVSDTGPYARLLRDLLAEYAEPIRRMLARYDALVAAAPALPDREVLTHGEPHPANTMLTATGDWLLIDWDMALIAPPERDLWHLAHADGAAIAAYTEATGITPVASLMQLYRFQWDVKDIAYDVSRFRRRHSGTAEDEKAWDGLSTLVAASLPGKR